MDEKRADVGGVPMRWLEQGEGTAVVLIHGIPTSPVLWRRVMPLVTDARVLAWEMVGYGRSIPAGRGRDLSLSSQADHLREWMRAIGIDRAVLVGHDLGGGVAHIAAIRDPSICAGLVLTNAVGYDSWPIPSVKALRRMGPLLSRLPAGVVKGILGMLMARGHDDGRVARESLELHYQPYREHGTDALVRQARALDTRDTLEVEGSIGRLSRVPARVVWGAADPFQKVSYGERFARDLGCPLLRIEGAKHFVPEDHPGALADAIEQVLREAERADVLSQPTPVMGEPYPHG